MGSVEWQTLTRSGKAQSIPSGNRWWPVVSADHAGRPVDVLWCLVDGDYDYDYALRIEAGRGYIWLRVARVRMAPGGDIVESEAGDNGTRWVGPLRLYAGMPRYIAGHLMDRKGGIGGHGYRLEIRSTLGCKITQAHIKMDRRGAAT